MSKFALAAFALCLMLALSEAIHRNNIDDEIAQWALDEIGPGYALINVKRIKRKHIDGTLYDMKLKVSMYRLGGQNKSMNCKVKVILFRNRKTLLSHRCRSAGRGSRDFGSVGVDVHNH